MYAGLEGRRSDMKFEDNLPDIVRGGVLPPKIEEEQRNREKAEKREKINLMVSIIAEVASVISAIAAVLVYLS